MILILDYGSQYTQLIARRIREAFVYCEIHPFNYPIPQKKFKSLRGIILSGGPSSVHMEGAPDLKSDILSLDIPVLGICYGMQLLAKHFGGEVTPSGKREYGQSEVNILDKQHLFKGIHHDKMHVWMSHGDSVTKLSGDFKVTAESSNSAIAAIEHVDKKIFGLQFHPEVTHTKEGTTILRNFLFNICGCRAFWDMKGFLDRSVTSLKEQIGKKNIICGLSGGVDSSVVAVLLHKAVGDQLTCIFVDNGLLRMDEREDVERIFREHFKINLRVVDARRRFLDALSGVTDPERKRKIIGHEFIEVFEEEAHKIKNVEFLAQGTLYPDVIESVSFKGPSAVIKSHHNVGGLPEKMNLKLVEPLRELFKDEVRKLGRELLIPEEIIGRHPFPGPGLAVRIIGEITDQALEALRNADAILEEEIRLAELYDKLWQAFCVYLPINTVGVMGDDRTYENVIAIRAVESQDAMTADFADLPKKLLSKISNRIINEVTGINRVVYDISSKPPATIEWE